MFPVKYVIQLNLLILKVFPLDVYKQYILGILFSFNV